MKDHESAEATLKVEKETSSKNVAEIFSKSQALTEKHGMLTQISRQHEETLKNQQESYDFTQDIDLLDADSDWIQLISQAEEWSRDQFSQIRYSVIN